MQSRIIHCLLESSITTRVDSAKVCINSNKIGAIESGEKVKEIEKQTGRKQFVIASGAYSTLVSKHAKIKALLRLLHGLGKG